MHVQNTDHCVVMRGNHAKTLCVWGLVVGDVIKLVQGDKVPADCLILSSLELKVVHNNDEVIKGADDPFLLVDSLVVDGQCRALVCCVGQHSTRSEKALVKQDF